MISVIEDGTLKYPDQSGFYSPDEHFPEYQHLHISSSFNPVYRAVRACLAQAALDQKRIGSSAWNPLGEFIKPGSNVFVLCNFVYHKRIYEKQKDFFAKCTHGSVLRSVLDYVLLAVGKSGRVRFGNAPIQSCDWEKVLEETGALRVVDFYKKSCNQIVEPCDLRSYIVKGHLFGGITPLQKKNSPDEIEVDLEKDSLLEDLYRSNEYPKFRSLDYGPNLTEGYHGQNKHIYVINRKILGADIIISLPKLKTHEKVGATLGIKGCVGGIAHKHCLPHFRMGAPRKGGDEYQNGQWLNWLESRLRELVDAKGTPFYNKYLRTMNFILRRLIKRVIGRNIGGGWAGNDTAWRMALDIARIAQYAAPDGSMRDLPMRKQLVLLDGITGGEGKGPLNPSPVQSGIVLFSDNQVIADYVSALMMGFNPAQIPIIREAFALHKYPLTNPGNNFGQLIYNGQLCSLSDLSTMIRHRYKPPRGWKGKL